MSSVCIWTKTPEGQYGTQCGNLFEFMNGGPEENGAKYCQYCGKEIEPETPPRNHETIINRAQKEGIRMCIGSTTGATQMTEQSEIEQIQGRHSVLQNYSSVGRKRFAVELSVMGDQAHKDRATLLRIVDQLRAENQKLHDALLPGEYNHLEINEELRAELAAAQQENLEMRTWIANAQHFLTCKSWGEINNCTCGKNELVAE